MCDAIQNWFVIHVLHDSFICERDWWVTHMNDSCHTYEIALLKSIKKGMPVKFSNLTLPFRFSCSKSHRWWKSRLSVPLDRPPRSLRPSLSSFQPSSSYSPHGYLLLHCPVLRRSPRRLFSIPFLTAEKGAVQRGAEREKASGERVARERWEKERTCAHFRQKIDFKICDKNCHLSSAGGHLGLSQHLDRVQLGRQREVVWRATTRRNHGCRGRALRQSHVLPQKFTCQTGTRHQRKTIFNHNSVLHLNPWQVNFFAVHVLPVHSEMWHALTRLVRGDDTAVHCSLEKVQTVLFLSSSAKYKKWCFWGAVLRSSMSSNL